MAGLSVRHWFSTLFVLITLTALYLLFKPREYTLERSEKVLLWIFGGFFLLYPLGLLFSEFGHDGGRYLGVEIRYLLAIPIYLMVRQYPGLWIWLVRGAAIGGFVACAQAVYDIRVLGFFQAMGIYGPTLFGPYAAFLVVASAVGLRYEKALAWRLLHGAAIVAALVALGLTGSRAGYLAVIAMSVFWALTFLRGRWLVVTLALSCTIPTGAYLGSDFVKHRVDRVHQEAATYFALEDPSRTPGKLADDRVRIEMWRTALFIISEHPISGVGRGNYTDAAQSHVEQGHVHPEVAHHGHPHNAYLEAWVSKGILGFTLFLAMLALPLYLFLSRRDLGGSAALGVIHLVGIATVSLVDGSVIIKGNFTSILLLTLCVAMGSLMYRKHAQAHD